MKVLLIVPEFGDETIFKKMIDVVNEEKLEKNKFLKYNIINYQHCQNTLNNLQKDHKELKDYFINDICRTNEKV